MKISLLKQSLNIAAIRNLLVVMKKPSLMIPNNEFVSINDIDFKKLKNVGIKYVVFDKDNTVWYKN
jgi:hypothetical protein